jgi:hypothetical protein
MSKIEHIHDGRIQNDTFFLVVADRHRSAKLAGFRLPDITVEYLIDRGVEYITFIDNVRGRYTISLDDWILCRVWSNTDQWQDVSQSFMTRG